MARELPPGARIIESNVGHPTQLDIKGDLVQLADGRRFIYHEGANLRTGVYPEWAPAPVELIEE